MDRKKKKTLAFWLYAAYLVILITVISVGKTMGLSNIVTEAFQQGWIKLASSTNIEDVRLHNTSFAPGKYHVLSYDVIGEYSGNPGIVFEPIDDAFKKFTKSGTFTTKTISEESVEARIRVTSKYDPDFEKILTVTIAKTYPTEFDVKYLSLSVGYNTTAVVGVPISVYIDPKEGETYTHKSFELIYDPEYFRLESGNVLVPIKATPKGEKITFACRCPNGAYAESEPFSITTKTLPEEFDEVRVWYGDKWQNISEVTFGSNKNYVISLYKNGKRVYSGYEVIVEENKTKKVLTGMLKFYDVSTSDVTVRLPGGFEKTFEVNVFNDLKLPTVSGESLRDDGTITVTDTGTTALSYKFASAMGFQDLEFEYDKKALSLTVSDKKIHLKGLKEGETELTLVLDDGEQRVTKTFTVYVESAKTIFEKIYDQAHKIMAKSIGHFTSFALLAVFAANFFRFVEMKRKWLRFLLYSSGAFAAACLTEFIQSFMPSRTAKLTDIMIDMLGFYIGTAVIVLLVFIIKKLLQRFRRGKE